MTTQEITNQNEIITRDDLIAMREMVSQTAKFIALYEQASQKIERHEIAGAQRLEASEDYFRTRLKEINHSLAEMQNIMSEVGVARFSVAAENILADGQQHVDALQTASTELYDRLASTLMHLEESVRKASDEVAEVAKYVRYDEIKQVTLTAVQKINETTEVAVRRLTGTLSWLHWERISVIFIIALVVALTSSFVGGGWSWHTDAQPEMVAQELQAGKATLSAWPELSVQDRELIKRALKKVS